MCQNSWSDYYIHYIKRGNAWLLTLFWTDYGQILFLISWRLTVRSQVPPLSLKGIRKTQLSCPTRRNSSRVMMRTGEHLNKEIVNTRIYPRPKEPDQPRERRLTVLLFQNPYAREHGQWRKMRLWDIWWKNVGHKIGLTLPTTSGLEEANNAGKGGTITLEKESPRNHGLNRKNGFWLWELKLSVIGGLRFPTISQEGPTILSKITGTVKWSLRKLSYNNKYSNYLIVLLKSMDYICL